jgi:hypothetical protein
MNRKQGEAIKAITDLILSLPWTERAEVFSAVRYNDVFCVYCGWGERDQPNPRCQCENDE